MNYLCLECGQRFRTKNDGRLARLRCSNCSSHLLSRIGDEEMVNAEKVIDLKTGKPLILAPKKDF